MKVKEISRTANMAWSPSSLQSISVACGTVAQQLDATFSTSACLEVFSLDLASSGLDMPLLGTVESPHRFHKLAWSGVGIDGDHPSGLIVGGSDNGIITIWSADRIIKLCISYQPLPSGSLRFTGVPITLPSSARPPSTYTSACTPS